MNQLLKMNINKHIKELAGLFLPGLRLSSLCLLATFAQHANAENSSSIVKWRDDKGATHYGDRIPAQYANRENSIINRQGIIVKHNKPTSYQDEVLDIAKLEQDKKDKALLSAFTSENEIDLARDRNLQLDKMILENLQLEKSNSQKRLAENQKYVDSFIKRKKPVPADLSDDIKTNQAELAKQDQQIAERKASMEITRKRFDEDKNRYITLKNHTNVIGASLEAPPTAKP